ncbi:MAG: glycoside hydrolase, partial [Clostridia bacterium]|nr:glycoside hydrolase [Clostridia bacterium]
HWWNGFSCVVDMSNPDAAKWFRDMLDYLMTEYGVDGFKFDAGDVQYYRNDDVNYGGVTAHEQCELWAKLGLEYPLNEYRACYKCAGLPLVQRLCDKAHQWGAVAKLLPDILTQGILGFPYGCPDMIGGGSFTDFLPGAPSLKPELFARYAQCAALMPMMQYSAAPWRVLTK